MKPLVFVAVAALAVTALATAEAQTQRGPQGPGFGPAGPGFGHRQGPGPIGRPAPQKAETERIVETGLGKLRAFASRNRNADPAAVMAFAKREIEPHFDFAHMARWSLGPRWREMSRADRAKAIGWLRGHFMRTLARHVGLYGDARVRVRDARSGHDGRAVTSTVPVAVTRPDGRTTSLEFRFYTGADGWKIYDVKANGHSALMYYRNALSPMTRGGGPRRAVRPGPY